MRDRDDCEVDEIARKAFIQVDNPHVSQWTDMERKKFGHQPKPHWQGSVVFGKTYQSTKVLGELFNLLSEEGKYRFDPNDVEAEMNMHIREKIESASKKKPEKVEMMRKDTERRLRSFNVTLANMINSSGPGDEISIRTRNQEITNLWKQCRVDIENRYDEDDLSLVFAVLYEQTYFKSRDRMLRWNKPPYIFAWKVGHDYITRIIADGDAKKQGGGIAPTMVRGSERIIFGKNR